MEYVAGFMFDGQRVALIRKNRPQWQAGLLNGIGGKIEAGETPAQAMAREFWEETGRNVAEDRWLPFADLCGQNQDGSEWIVHFFTCRGSHAHLNSTTDEIVGSFKIDSLEGKVVSNLQYLIPMAQRALLNVIRDRPFEFLRIFENHVVAPFRKQDVALAA